MTNAAIGPPEGDFCHTHVCHAAATRPVAASLREAPTKRKIDAGAHAARGRRDP